MRKKNRNDVALPPQLSPGPQRAAISWPEVTMCLLFCLGLPIGWTVIAPVNYVRLERMADKSITATSSTCLLFFVPYSKQEARGVTRADDRLVEGQRDRRAGEHRRTKSDDEGFLVLSGPDDVLDVSVSPVNVKDTVARAQAFIDDPSQSRLDLFCVSNWKFAVIAGGPISLLVPLYLLGITLSFLRYLRDIATS